MSAPSDGTVSYSQLHSKARIYFVFALDFGFLLSQAEIGSGSHDTLLRLRDDGPVTAGIFGQNTVALQFGGLEQQGTWEYNEIDSRARHSEAAGGKAIWTSSILQAEAPYLFNLELGDKPPTINPAGVHFARAAQRVRIFPRGVLSLDQRWDLQDENISVATFIQAVKEARRLATRDAWERISGILRYLQENHACISDVSVEWSRTDASEESFIRQHLITHSIIFMDSLPGRERSSGQPSFDELSSDEIKPIAGVLNLTEWFELYAAQYVNGVFDRFVRNRQDEIYVTDNDASLVILKNYWTEGDTLENYQRDLVLAVHFELSRLTYLRYLAFYMRHAPVAKAALTLSDSTGRSALAFVLRMQRIVDGSGYDHPAEALVRHGFTRRFLAQLAHERGTVASLSELDRHISGISGALELRTGLDLSEQGVRAARGTLIATWLVIFLTGAAIIIAVISLVVANRDSVVRVDVPPCVAGQVCVTVR